MNARRLARIIKVSKGETPADLVIRNCQVVDPISRTIATSNIAIFDGYIVGVGDYRGENEIDGENYFAVSGLIDSHVHIESSMCTPAAFAELVVPFGTTAVIADPHEISNVKGTDGINFMLNSAHRVPLKVKFMAPSCVPCTNFEDSGAVIDADDMEELISDSRIFGLGELMNAPGLHSSDPEVLEKLCLAINAKKTIDGHAPGLTGKLLNAYRVAGITTDHECVNAEEVRARLRRGMYVLLRQGSAAQNLRELLPGVDDVTARRCAMCSDDKHPGDIIQYGHMNHNLRIAVECGVSPFTAISMATINAAECYHMRNMGLIAPGYHADIVLFDNLKDFNAKKVFINGALVAENGKALFEVTRRVDKAITHSVNIAPVTAKDLQIPIKGDEARVMQLKNHDLITNCVARKVDTKDGFFTFNKNSDIQKLVVVERHKATGKVGVALVENYGLKNGALGTTVAHDSHNMIVVGDDDEAILMAISELERCGGGMTIVHDGKVAHSLELPIAGIMSDKSAPVISKKVDEMIEFAHSKMGINRNVDPFMTISFLSLPVIPQIKITPRGLFDVEKFDFVDVSL